MFDFFKKNKDNHNLDVKGLRNSVLQFIKEELQHLDGGEGTNVAGLALFVHASAEERFLYETVLYCAAPEKLREEIQRIADNFALDLPAEWKLEIQFAEALPVNAIIREDIKIGLVIKTISATPVNSSIPAKAFLKILRGKAEQEEYLFNEDSGRINIGREKTVQTNDGSLRINSIVFLEISEHEDNKYVSRQHAHIEWDEKSACFKLYADEGGAPPGNKTKIKQAEDESLYKLNSIQIGYQLRDGDQIILGDAAILEFTFLLI